MTRITKQNRDIYTDELLNIIRYTGLLLPFFVILIGFGVKFGYFDNTYYQSDAALIAISLSYIVLGIWQMYTTRYGVVMQAINVSLYHVVSGLFILFVTGFVNPIVFCWAALAIVADILFGRSAILLSILSLWAVAWLHFSITPPTDGQQVFNVINLIASIAVIAFIVSFFRSVSDNERLAFHKTKKQHLLQRDRLTTLINAMNDAVISTDMKGTIRVYNAATLNLLDTNTTLSGMSINTVLNLFDENNNPTDLKEVLKNNQRTTRRDLSHRYDNGEIINLYISLAPVRPTYHQKSTQNGFIIVLRDITKEKSLEEERDEFISVVSHELRTPVAITEGNLSNILFLLERGSEGEALTGAVNEAHTQVIYLARMINDLSTLSRAERGVADEPEDINVNVLMETLYNEYRPQAEAKKLAINLDLLGPIGDVSASKLYLEEILQNFVTNAIKYTPEGSITIGARKTSSHTVEFYVKDSGIGMSKADQKHIYEKFYRSEDYRTRETSGTGLGLYVVRKLSQKLNISIDLKSRLNHGSTFSFTMPLITKTK